MTSTAPGDVMPASRGAFTFGMVLDRRSPHPDLPRRLRPHDRESRSGPRRLARWPSSGVSPDVAFGSATQQGRLSELDEACRDAAIDDAITRGLPPRFELFVNLEPSVLGTRHCRRSSPERLVRSSSWSRSPNVRWPDARPSCSRAVADPQGRRLCHRPRRRRGRPDVAGPPPVRGAGRDQARSSPWSSVGINVEQAAIYTAVAAYAERTGRHHSRRGHRERRPTSNRPGPSGATLGQGWYLSRPGPLGPAHLAQPRAAAPPVDAPSPPRSAPSACSSPSAHPDRAQGNAPRHLPPHREPGARPRDTTGRARRLSRRPTLHPPDRASLRPPGGPLSPGRRTRG